jgi:hypothetical protein
VKGSDIPDDLFLAADETVPASVGLIPFDLGPAWRSPWLTPVPSPLRGGQP